MKYDLIVQSNETALFGNNNKRIKILIVWSEKGSGGTKGGALATTKTLCHGVSGAGLHITITLINISTLIKGSLVSR